ncbi:MAG: hypothetical protein M1828_001004 [Chrysothrix sp. TS-e1954]|nr:MAG: hypothetical protein M1828_001004 [Chrysothrix sp. TS-e1954]
MQAIPPSKLLWRTKSRSPASQALEAIRATKADTQADTAPVQSIEPSVEKQIDLLDLNHSLVALSAVFPNVKLEVFREMLSSFSVESRLQVVTEALLRNEARYVQGRWRVPDQEDMLQRLGQKTDKTQVPIPIQDQFRSDEYKTAVKYAFYEEFKGLSHATIKAVLAERNHSYSASRPILLDLISKSWRYSITNLFSRRRNIRMDCPFVVSFVEDGRTRYRLKPTSSTQLDDELKDNFIAPFDRDILEAQISGDQALARQLNEEEAEAGEATFDCQCCFMSTTFERLVVCSQDGHYLCFACIRHTVNEALYGQGWARSVDLSRSSIKCVAVPSDSQGECPSYVSRDSMRRAMISERDGEAALDKFEDRVARDCIVKSKLDVVKCPFCSYAEEIVEPPRSNVSRNVLIDRRIAAILGASLLQAFLPPTLTIFFVAVAVLTYVAIPRRRVEPYLGAGNGILEDARHPSNGRKGICRNSSCDLYKTEDEDVVVRRAKEQAEKDWYEQEGSGLSDAARKDLDREQIPLLFLIACAECSLNIYFLAVLRESSSNERSIDTFWIDEDPMINAIHTKKIAGLYTGLFLLRRLVELGCVGRRVPGNASRQKTNNSWSLRNWTGFGRWWGMQASDVKKKLASAELCSSDDVRTFRRLLHGRDGSLPIEKKDQARAQGSGKTAPTRTSRPKNIKTAKVIRAIVDDQPEIPVHEDAVYDLTVSQRYALATEAVNVILKTLAKVAASPIRRPQSKSPERLQERSPNMIRPSQTSVRASKPEPGVQNEAQNVGCIAEAGKIALSYLDDNASPASSRQGAFDERLYDVRMAFVGRLITLGLTSQALEQLHELKSGLKNASAIGGRTAKASNALKTSTPVTGEDSLTNLFVLGELALGSEQDLVRVVTYQLAALRLLTASPGLGRLGNILPSLATSHSASPVRNLVRLCDCASSKDDVLTKMELLSQLLLRVAANIYSDNVDEEVSHTRLKLRASLRFRYQVLALQIRCIWVTRCQHKANLAKELCQPLARYLNQYERDGDADPVARWRDASDAFDALHNDMNRPGISSSDEMRNVLECSSRIAENAGCTLDATKATERLIREHSQAGRAANQVPAWSVRLAALSLYVVEGVDLNVRSARRQLKESCRVLEVSLDDTSTNHTALLREVNHLRRAARAYVCSTSPKQKTACRPANELDEDALIALQSCSRYLSRFCDSQDQAQNAQAYEQSLVQQMLLPFVDTALAVLQCLEKGDGTASESLAGLLSSTVELVEGHGTVILQASETRTRKQANDLLLRLSQMLWLFASKDPTQHNATMSSRMEAACKILQMTSGEIQERGGLPTKLCKFARLEYKSSRTDKALATFQRVVDIAVRDEDMRNGVGQQPLRWLMGDTTESKTLLNTALRSILEIQLLREMDDEPKRSTPFYDKVELTVDCRGLLLEWQLTLLLTTFAASIRKPGKIKDLKSLATTLLHLYSASKYPIRRLRVSLKVLGINDPCLAELRALCMSENLQQDDTTWGNDTGLASFFKHAQYAVRVYRAMEDIDAVSNKELLSTIMRAWSEMLTSSESTSNILALIDDYDGWLQLLRSMCDVLERSGHQRLLVTASSLLIKALELSPSPTHSREAKTASFQLCRMLLDMGYSEKAGMLLAKTKAGVRPLAEGRNDEVELTLTELEYFRRIGSIDKAHSLSASLRYELTKHTTRSTEMSPLKDSSTRLQSLLTTVDILQCVANVQHDSGDINSSIYLTKRSSSMLLGAWKSIQRQTQANSNTTARKSEKTEEVSDDVADLSSSANGLGRTPERDLDPRHWHLATKIFQVQTRLAEWYAQCDQSRSIILAITEIEKVAQTMAVPYHLAESCMIKGNFECRQGDLESGHELFTKAANLWKEDSRQHVAYHTSMGRYYHLQNAWSPEMQAYEDADDVVKSLAAPEFLGRLPGSSMSLDDVSQSMASLSITPRPPTKASRSTTKVPSGSKKKSSSLKPSTGRSQKDESVLRSIDGECILLDRLRNDVVCLKAESYLEQGRFEEAQNLLLFPSAASTGPSFDVALTQALLARILLRRCLSTLASHPVFSSLPESTIAFPAVTPNPRRLSAGDLHRYPSCSPPNAATQNSGPRSKTLKTSRSSIDVSCTLIQALQHSAGAQGDSRARSNGFTRAGCATIAMASMLLSFSELGTRNASLHPTAVAKYLDLPAIIAACREQNLARIDTVEATERHKGHEVCSELGFADYGNITATQYQQDFIDIIPDTWTVISLNLDKNCNHLTATRYTYDQTPFILRLPLERQNSDETEEPTFSYAQAHKELMDIIKASDDSVSRGKDELASSTAKSAKSKWWNERELLDDRMHRLLLNIESAWFGGFRGILSSAKCFPESLSRFEAAFDDILQKHLPSRRNTRKGGSPTQVALDSRIYELFVNMMVSEEAVEDMEEAFTDLLYFVVDILQFNGEANAYDEIDFDAIIVEVQDALETYHKGLSGNSSSAPARHTILILDRPLHIFPWESLPCLQNQSVTRLPSMLELRDRVLAMRRSPEAASTSKTLSTSHGIQVSRDSGTYILNPSGDLTKTQSRFKDSLSSLQSASTPWSSIVNQAPSEVDFSSALSPRAQTPGTEATVADLSRPAPNLLLYFGHGPGTQYIRPRKIARMRFPAYANPSMTTNAPKIDDLSTKPSYPDVSATCNAALLFGCSSASLTVKGDFEPYGTPKTYLMAGAPAVLGSLWDVTDGDVDRFAGATLENWGLFEEGKLGWQKWGRGRKGKKKAVAQRENGQKWDLSMAASVAREGCYLRWLNGAAMVVYGVPCYLS